MIDVWLGTVAVALLAAAYVVVGARRRRRHAAPANDAKTTFAQRRDDLQAEGRLQGLDAAAIQALEEELALDALDSPTAPAGADHGARHVPRPPLPQLLGGALAVAALAIGLYALWGEPRAAVLAQASQLIQADASDPAALERLRQALVDRTRRKPRDGDAWFFLAHLHMQAGDYASAAEAFAALSDIAGANEQIDVAWAQASYLADDGAMSAATRDIVSRAAAANPNHPELLELLAMDALRSREYLLGARYLLRALGQPLQESRRGVLMEMLALARERLDPERPLIAATIHIDGQPMRWLMVFARPPGGGMPLAAVRLPARETQTVLLDDAASMNEAHSLSGGGLVEVVARLSDTGDATASGPEAVSAPVDATTQPRVELTLTPSGPAQRAISIEVTLAEELDAVVPIFVIARDPSGGDAPVAVRRLFAADLPARIELSDADAMLPGRRLSDLEVAEVVARASIGGTPSAQSGDLSSAAATVRLGTETVTTLHIDQRLP